MSKQNKNRRGWGREPGNQGQNFGQRQQGNQRRGNSQQRADDEINYDRGRYHSDDRRTYENPDRKKGCKRANDVSNDIQRRKYQPRQMGFKMLRTLLDKTDVEEITLEVNNSLTGFKMLLDSDEVQNDIVVLVIKLLKVVCGCNFQETSISLLQTALTSNFIKNLTNYVSSIVSQQPHDKKFNNYFWKDPDDFWKNIIHISKFIHDTIPSYCEEIRKLLMAIDLLIPGIEQSHSLHISDDVKVNIKDLISVINETMKEMERKKQENKAVTSNKEEEPPDDFHNIPVVPSGDEVTTNRYNFLRKNVIKGPYEDVHHYLDVQFRLLREDFVAPLRHGICSYRSKEKRKLDDIRIYNSIRFLGSESVNAQDCYRIQFDFSQKRRNFKSYENARRFMFGSLVLFTSDEFKTLLFANIVGRDTKYLEKGQLIVGFHEPVEIDYNVPYLMVESKVYFEPYYQVLRVLQQISYDNFPMERYIIKVEKDCNPPNYLLQTDPVFYEIEGTRFSPLDFPLKKFYGLNDAQHNAFKAALTKEFVIIQGPPGTGKTFLGLKIAQTLLENPEAWDSRSPMLVICYTNHALDQFLEGLLPVTKRIVRVGGQSKNNNLKEFNLAKRRKFQNHAVYNYRDEVRNCLGVIQHASKELEIIKQNDRVINFKNFEGCRGYTGSWFARASKGDIGKWLLGDRTIIPVNTDRRRFEPRGSKFLGVQENMEIGEFDMFDDYDEYMLDVDDVYENLRVENKDHPPIFNLQEMADKMAILNRDLDSLRTTKMSQRDRRMREVPIYGELEDLDRLLTCLKRRLARCPQIVDRARMPYSVDFYMPHHMTNDDRWFLYYFWLRGYRDRLVREHRKATAQYKLAVGLYNNMRDMEDVQMMKEQLVIGMTTTGAARLQDSLKALKSPIVIVEEAAEVLEAHIVAALTEHCRHLILIGDHQQLKPSTANFQIETKFKLGISLFERMVLNEIECHTLNIQHRMRPEISRLITPTIYPALTDHESTLNRDGIRGVEQTVFFVEHDKKEEVCSDSSKKNVHEAQFAIALARHLILNGYRPEDITILSAYLGQMFEMQRERRLPHNQLLLQDVRIAVLDNYQGEESNIIILSLVRSNDEGKVGFLQLENRVCVALSRARDGLYAIGNMKMLCEKTEIWQKVRQTLEEHKSIGPSLTLRCQVHRHKITHVRCVDDFRKTSEGGCDEKCNAELACGHRCPQLCHVINRDHATYRCQEKCLRTLCDDETHICQKKYCWEECGPCMYTVRRTFECGHAKDIACHIDPQTYECLVILKDVKLPCGHVADKPCDADLDTFGCPHYCDKRVEPCGHQCNRTCHLKDDPDHLKYKCRQPCAKQRVGCKDPENPSHVCPNLCHEKCEDCSIKVRKTRTVCPHSYEIACSVDVDKLDCAKPCKKELPCGHKCRSPCSEPCGPCAIPVERTVPVCGHKAKIPCHEEASKARCNGKCPLSLPCGHPCREKCKEECTAECKQMVDCDIPTPCGHRASRIECHLKDTADAQVLLEKCTVPCGAKLKCDHACSGTCGACLQGRFHVPCSEKCGVPQVCGHECQFPCRDACKPCERPCQFRCRHSRCTKKCGEPCTPCSQKCSRRCVHQQCKKRCGDICDVPPCAEPCRKKLTCGHPCLGFCGETCPRLCSQCDPDEFESLLATYATEDEAVARLVLLKECRHIVVSEGMEKWLRDDGDAVKAKECPQCRTPLATTERYSDYVKQALRDVSRVQEKSYGKEHENKKKCSSLSEKLLLSGRKARSYHSSVYHALQGVFNMLINRMKPSQQSRRQTINSIEINSIERKIQIVELLVETFKDFKNESNRERVFAVPWLLKKLGRDRQQVALDHSLGQLKLMTKILTRSVEHTTDQEIGDLEDEMYRLHRLAQLDRIRGAPGFECAKSKGEVKAALEKVDEVFKRHGKFTKQMDAELRALLEDLNKTVGSSAPITDAERLQIVAAVNVRRGAWFKCRCGLPYAIGECGGAMEVGRCINCNKPIGGRNHRPVDGQRLATEMDGAVGPAYPSMH